MTLSRWLPPRLSRWLPPLASAALFVALAPFVGELRHVLKESFGLRYLAWLAAILGLAGVAAFGVAVYRIREHRRLRYALLALAAALVAWQVIALGIGNAEVDVVERVHLLEFGLLGVLFERAFRPRHRNALLPVLVLTAVGLCGLADEWVQWLTPARTGDARDVLLNLYAGGVGYLLGVALSSERGRRRRPGPESRRLAAGLVSLFVLAAALFFDAAHLGYEVHDPVAGVFRSWRTPEELARAAEERDRRWAAEGVPEPRPLALEDTYWTEAGFHVGARDRAAARGDVVRAWRENRILERWYAPLLDHRPGTRWPEEQRVNTEAEARARLGGRDHLVDRSPRYRTPTLADRIAVAPPRGLFWFGALLVAVVPAAGWLRLGLRWPFGGGADERPGRRRHAEVENRREVSRE